MKPPPPIHLVDLALPVPLTGVFTYRWTTDVSAAPPVVGDLARAPFGRRRGVIGLVVAVRPDTGAAATAAGVPLRDLEGILDEAYRLLPDRLRLAHWLAGYYAVDAGEVVPLFHPPRPGTRARRTGRAARPFPLDEQAPAVLTAAQSQVVAAGCDLLDRRVFGALLLHGVTGSGKTEAYLRVIEAALDRGRGAIYLLPEIALTPQTLARIVARFGERAATIHSGLSAGERCRVHEEVAAGRISVVVGPRSALFAPVRDLGVVVVDEEHETSYKQDEKPRYHARDAALVRGREAAAVVLLGSATPDLASWHNATAGRYRLLSLPERLGGDLPAVELVDLRGASSPDGFSERLLTAVGETLADGKQAIIYHNRRGFARQLQCRDCGAVVMCPHCDIGLTVHLRPHRLLCHYCGCQREAPGACPQCRSPAFLSPGSGTERTELVLQAMFPAARVLRLDHDSTRLRGSHARILGAFVAREADILVGTQMVAKGHHFPGVDLVGVLAADDGLSLPDYRAGERCFQLLTQVAGRAGREAPGRVLLQTWQPSHPIIQAAAAHDFLGFARSESAHRRAAGYPPYTRLLRLGLSGPRQGQTEQAAGQLAVALARQLGGPDLEILGPAPAVFGRLHNRYRQQILLKGELNRVQKRWLAGCCRALREVQRGLDIAMDVDPVGLW